MLDADGSTHPAEIDRFIDVLQAGADFVKGSRHLSGGGSADFTLLRRSGNRALVAMANTMYGSRFSDLCYGYCAFWRRHLDTLGLTADGFEIETQLVLSAVRAGLRIHEVPSYELKRRAGKSNLNAYRDGRRVLATMLRERRRPASPRLRSTDPIALVHTNVAADHSRRWLPAGHDHRRGDRRNTAATPLEYRGPERRRRDRRTLPARTWPVYIVGESSAGEEAVLTAGAAATAAASSR